MSELRLSVNCSAPHSTDNDTEWFREPLLPDRVYLIRTDGFRVDEKGCHRMCPVGVLVSRGTNMAAGFNPVRVQLVEQHRDAINDAFLFVLAQLRPIRMHQNTTVSSDPLLGGWSKNFQPEVLMTLDVPRYRMPV